jgi:amino acid adenylation domain-containing protein
MQDLIQGFQLSPQQKRLWLLQEDSDVYRANCAILIDGNLNVEGLKAALHQIVNRHEILRTRFHRTRGIKVPIQVIGDQGFLSIQEVDLSHENVNDEIQADSIQRLLPLVSQESLDDENDSLLQIALARLSSKQYLLFIELPSLCADAATLENLRRELSQTYTSFLLGKALEPEDEPLQYVALSEWQNELLESDDTEAGRDYWRRLDSSSWTGLTLPFPRISADETAFAPQVFRLIIPPELTENIKVIADTLQISISAVFLTCWQVLLWRHTDTSDIVIGVGADGRIYEELNDALGLLVRYLPLHSHLEAEDKFAEVVAQVEQSLNHAYGRQHYFPWEEIVTPNQTSQGLFFFPFCFEFESRVAEYFAGDISFSLYQQYTCTEPFQLKLSCISQGEELIAEFHYDANCFCLNDIQRLAERFEALLTSIVENPESAIAQYNILSPQEYQQLLIEFNQTQTGALPYACIHHWFEEQASRTPDRIAVVCENQQLTYRQLNQNANQLAHYLQKRGVKPDVLVGICLERSLEMLVAVLGILKAGGAYVPLEPSYPKERLGFILSDTQAPLLLTQQTLLETLPEHQAELLCLDTDWSKIAQERSENPVSNTTAAHLAYVIYTSGSTGKPKGVLIPHQGLVNYLNWCTQAYDVEQGEGAIVHSSLAFDLTITGLFSPLLVGRRVELIRDNMTLESLSTAFRKQSNLSLIKLTPAQLLLLSQQISSSKAAGRTRAFIIGGENLLAETLTFWQEFAPETILVNEYGPTETVVGCCIYQVPQGEPQSGAIPIGRPIANTQLYVLNQYLQPVPIGVVGELYIGGAGVARGYLNRPELTAAKFISNPFSDEPGSKLYKTGDLVRHRIHGNLEFLGRIDDQVKIRGFRIELGEVEAVLCQHPGVKETVVMAQEDVPGDQRLVAYLVWHPEYPASMGELRHFLQQRLPDYMIPSTFFPLKALPLTTNGKVDKRSLLALDGLRPELEPAYVPPSSEMEQTIATVWQEVLHLENVGIHDNFFDLGGHSLLIAQVHRQLQDLLKKPDLSVIELIQYPTIQALVNYLNQEPDDKLDVQSVRDRAQKQKAAMTQQRKLTQK